MARILLLIAAIFIIWFLLRWIQQTPAEKLTVLVKKALLWGGISILILLVLTGRLNWIFAAVAASIPLLTRGLTFLRMLPVIREALATLGLTSSVQKNSVIKTKYLQVIIEHTSGALSGTILSGQHTGQALKDLNINQLINLLSEFNDDFPTQQLLMNFLDRSYGSEWRSKTNYQQHSGESSHTDMSPEIALEILGLDKTASKEEIKIAHKKLIQKLHPDRGGSQWLAKRINQARDTLL